MTRKERGGRDREIAARFGAAAKARRLRLGLTHGAIVSRVTGLDEPTLSRVERGETGERWAIGLWIDLARALGWTLGEFFRAAFPKRDEDELHP